MNSIAYTHFGKPADVWKHLALCMIMQNEQPGLYIETNSAAAEYLLDHTPEQEYGIYLFLEKAKHYPELIESSYYKCESAVIDENKYLGSPGLAMLLLKNVANKFIFYDIEKAALDNVSLFALKHNLLKKIQAILQDSLIGIIDRFFILSESTLLHIDPYEINRPSTNGYDYMDLFVKASQIGAKCVLWYGYHTLAEKKELNYFIHQKLRKSPVENLCGIELIMDIIQENTVLSNPGVLGNGLLASNLSLGSRNQLLQYSLLLEDIYKESSYQEFNGGIYRDLIIQ